jgi:formate hydrogenlyase transcriptional activator
MVFDQIVGSSESLQKVMAETSKVALSDSTVLILGETGTGKELIARAIHKRSRRATSPFIAVNCGAIPPSLIASELFGHEKGSFTGASQRRHGRFEVASGGTIFLDEVGDLPPDAQIALLRVLQEREFERVGHGYPPRPSQAGEQWQISQRPLLQIERCAHRCSAAARANPRHPGACGLFHRSIWKKGRKTF